MPINANGLKHQEVDGLLPDWLRHAPQAPQLSKPYQGEPFRCYRIANEYVKLMVAVLDYYANAGAFSGELEERQTSAQRVSDLQVYLMVGEEICEGEMAYTKFRQNPEDPCVLQVSYDGGQTWETMFNYGLCLRASVGNAPINAPQVIASANSFASAQIALYDQTLVSIAPNMVHDESSMDEYRDLAMCLWVHNVVSAVAAAALAYRDVGDNFWTDIRKAILHANIFMIDAILWLNEHSELIPEIPATTIFELLRNGFEQQLGELNSDELAAFGDPDALQAIHCYAYDRLQGNSVSETDFRTMFDGISELDQITDEMEDFAASLIDSERAYVMFMSLLDDLPAKLESGEAEYECPCGEWSHDVTALMEIDPDPYDKGAQMGGTYSEGVWLHKDAKRDPASSYYYRSLSLKLVFPAALITRIQVNDYTLLAFAYDDMALWLDGIMVQEGKTWTHDSTGYHIGYTTPEFSWTTTQINLLATCDRDTVLNQLNGTASLYQITVYGRGYNPFI